MARGIEKEQYIDVVGQIKQGAARKLSGFARGTFTFNTEITYLPFVLSRPEDQYPLYIIRNHIGYILHPQQPDRVERITFHDSSKRISSSGDRIRSFLGQDPNTASLPQLQELSDIVNHDRFEPDGQFRWEIKARIKTFVAEARATEHQDRVAAYGKTVKRLSEEIDASGKPGCLIVIFDDSNTKRQTFLKSITEHSQAVYYAVYIEKNPDELIKFVEAVWQQDTGYQLVIFMDGDLGDDRSGNHILGTDVANRLKKLAGEKGQVMPYLVGASGDDVANQALKIKYPDSYLGTFFETQEPTETPVFTAIEQKLRGR